VPCNVLIETIDKFGNHLDQGGVNVVARALGSSVSACVVDDHANGTYTVSFTCSVADKTSVVIRLDAAEMAPLELRFADPEAGDKPGGKKGAKKRAAEEAPAPTPAPAAAPS
jgi:hypothetical protein